MEFIADFHIHSKYSRATSKNMNIKNIAQWAKLKGITLMGTGDFTHHLWLEELKHSLEDLGNGLFKYQDIYFMLTCEISSIYSKRGRTYRIHNIITSPSFKTTDKINDTLARHGNLASDGRPILGMDAQELARIIFDIDENCMVVPAHCLLPDTLIHAKNGMKKIQDVMKNELVYTHRLNYKKVTKSLKRLYKGKIYNIRPYYFREGLKTTPEHPFLIIKSYKDCQWIGGICRPNCSEARFCRKKHFQHYRPVWFQAKDIEVGDIILYPRFRDKGNKKIDVKEIEISGFLNKKDYIVEDTKIFPNGSKVSKLNNSIKINREFCRLAGYFISEGYTNGRDCISFCFHSNELDYIDDVKTLMQNIFGIVLSRTQIKKTASGTELIYYSKILIKLFSRLFYSGHINNRAYSKCLPNWALDLPLDKQAEVLKGWWRGDTGYTSSRILMNQMKVILLRLGIIPSIRMDSKEAHKKRGKHRIGKRTVSAQHDMFQFSNLSFFKDEHNLLNEKCFQKFKTKLNRRHGWMDKQYVYVPIRDIEITDYKGEVYNLEVSKDNSYVSEFAIIHNCWTPWFSLFGSMSGFDRIEDCFEEQTPKIFALETGLSCYDQKTEVLTEDGWKKFSTVRYSDKICTLNLEKDKIEFQAPIKIFTYKYKGRMYKLKTKRVNLLVTPKHKLLYSPCDFRNPKPYSLKEADFLFGKSKRFKKDGIWAGEKKKYFKLPAVKIRHGSRYYSGFRRKKEKQFPVRDWLKFFGFWLAEGWTSEGKSGDYNVCVSNQNKNLLNEMKRILNSFGYRIFQSDNIVRVRDFQLFHYLKQFGKSSNKSIPLNIKSLSKDLLEILLKYYLKGDGHIYGRSKKGLSATTSSIRLRDDLQEIALKVGISAYYKLGQKKGTLISSLSYRGKTYKQSEDTWVVYFLRQNRPIILPSAIKKHNYVEFWSPYNGLVFCVEVPNHVIYIRREGIPLWCGNSDPAMNWRISALDKYALVSNSDSHSPSKIGREANVFDCELNYKAIRDVLRTKDKKRFLYTIEFFPEEGKYHFDGHRLCGVRFSPQETKEHKGKCPKCGKPLTVGVMSRVEQLADRPQGYIPSSAIPYKNLIPFEEIIAEAKGVSKGSVAVERDYRSYIARFGTELNILLRLSKEELLKGLPPRLAEGVLRVRQSQVNIKAGFDGEYGIISIFDAEARSSEGEKQLSFFNE